MANFEKTTPEAILPIRSTRKSAGYDLYANEPISIPANGRALVKTGITCTMEDNEYLAIVPRSGLAIKSGITVLNTPGTVDSDYRGEIKVNLINHSKTDFVVENGMRIAQFVIAKVESASFIVSEDLSSSERGEGGFGSTGVK